MKGQEAVDQLTVLKFVSATGWQALTFFFFSFFTYSFVGKFLKAQQWLG